MRGERDDPRRRWDERYRRGEHADPGEPAVIVRDALPLLRPGGPPVLDLACGAGRNTLFLARRGFRVLAVDLSGEGLGLLTRSVWAERLPVQPVHADLEWFGVRPGSVGVVVNTYFLLRSLFPLLRVALAPGGYLLFETYTVQDIDELGGTLRRELALERGELREAFGDLEPVLYEEGVFSRNGRQRGLARLIARRRPALAERPGMI